MFRKSAAISRRLAVASIVWRPCLKAFLFPLGAPGDIPPCIAANSFRRKSRITARAHALGFDRVPEFIVGECSKLFVAQFEQLLSRPGLPLLGHCCLLFFRG